MNFDPQKFFIGLMDFFSILLPGALFTYRLKVPVTCTGEGCWYRVPDEKGTPNGKIIFLKESHWERFKKTVKIEKQRLFGAGPSK